MTLFCTDGAIFVSSLRLSYLFEHCIVNLFDLKGSQRRNKKGKLPKNFFREWPRRFFFFAAKYISDPKNDGCLDHRSHPIPFQVKKLGTNPMKPCQFVYTRSNDFLARYSVELCGTKTIW